MLQTHGKAPEGSAVEYQRALCAVVSYLISQLKTFSIVMIAAIGITALIVAIVVLSWNRRLEKIVKARTRELEITNEQLKQNDKIQKEFINISAHVVCSLILVNRHYIMIFVLN